MAGFPFPPAAAGAKGDPKKKGKKKPPFTGNLGQLMSMGKGAAPPKK